jgi:hypothetical protein
MATQGTAVLDFGSTPAAEASVAVTGQTGIAADSLIEAWVMGSSTGDNNEGEHLFAGVALKLVCGIPTAGVGFTIYATSMVGLATGTFNIRWVWN